MTQGNESSPQGTGTTETQVSTGKTKTLGLDYNIAALLTYMPIWPVNLIFSIIWLNTEPKESRSLRFHATQSLIMCIAGMILSGASTIMHLLPIIGALVSILIGIVCVVMLAFDIIALINAVQGKIYRIPIIADFADKYNPA